MATLRLFAGAREAVGRSTIKINGQSVREVLDEAVSAYGERLGEVISISKIWLNGETVDLDAPVGETDEVAVLPPVSGGI